MKNRYCNNYVKEYREVLGITQQELARRSGTTQNTISAIEHGQIPSVSLAMQIAWVLKIRVDNLFVI